MRSWIVRMLAVGMALGLAGQTTAQDVRKIYRQYQRLWASGKKQEACAALGEADNVKAAQILIQTTLKHLIVPRNEKPKEAEARSAVVAGCVEGMGKFRAKKPVDLVVKLARGDRRMSPTIDHRRPFLEALGQSKTDAGAKLLLELSKKAKPGREQVVFSDAMKMHGGPLLIERWIKDLGETLWSIRVNAAKALAGTASKDAVLPLIGLLEDDHPKVSYWAHQALIGLTAQDHEFDKGDWTRWWAKHKGEKLAGKGLGTKAPKKSGSVVLKVPTYYGIKFQSKHVIFIIDISGSMGAIVRTNFKRPKASPNDKRPPSLRADWDDIRNRLDLAQCHLIYTLAHLDERTKFNIMVYSGANNAWRDDWVQATQKNKIEAVAYVKKTTAGGGTNILESLVESYAFCGKSSASNPWLEGADTIFIMTDGEPTVGSLTTASHKDYRERFAQRVKALGKDRHVTLFAIGIGEDHDAELMRQMAEAGGGIYQSAGNK